MRHILLYLAVLILASCGKHERVSEYDACAISFNAPVIHTKALVEGNSDLEGGFGVYAARYTSAYMQKDFISNLKVNQDGSYIDTYFWAPGAGHRFFAVYPWYDSASDLVDKGISYAVADSGKEIKVNYSTLTDILYDVALYDDPFVPGSNPGKITFELKHACAAISFSINNLSGKNIRSVSAKTGNTHDVQISGLNISGDLSIIEDGGTAVSVWENLSIGNLTIPSINVNGGNQWPHGQQRDWHTQVIVPQNYVSLDVNMSFRIRYDGGSYDDYEVDLSDIRTGEGGYEYKAGKHYKYKIDITNQDIMCYVTVVPWVEDDTIILE